mmetsp:Transcript_13611/g.48782  ORF Transcript_13611/g.48782 Transcript_13611/m.48782 type:complete len:442 (-) Transcript_13611:100-1425(-)
MIASRFLCIAVSLPLSRCSCASSAAISFALDADSVVFFSSASSVAASSSFNASHESVSFDTTDSNSADFASARSLAAFATAARSVALFAAADADVATVSCAAASARARSASRLHRSVSARAVSVSASARAASASDASALALSISSFPLVSSSAAHASSVLARARFTASAHASLAISASIACFSLVAMSALRAARLAAVSARHTAAHFNAACVCRTCRFASLDVNIAAVRDITCWSFAALSFSSALPTKCFACASNPSLELFLCVSRRFTASRNCTEALESYEMDTLSVFTFVGSNGLSDGHGRSGSTTGDSDAHESTASSLDRWPFCVASGAGLGVIFSSLSSPGARTPTHGFTNTSDACSAFTLKINAPDVGLCTTSDATGKVQPFSSSTTMADLIALGATNSFEFTSSRGVSSDRALAASLFRRASSSSRSRAAWSAII